MDRLLYVWRRAPEVAALVCAMLWSYSGLTDLGVKVGADHPALLPLSVDVALFWSVRRYRQGERDLATKLTLVITTLVSAGGNSLHPLGRSLGAWWLAFAVLASAVPSLLIVLVTWSRHGGSDEENPASAVANNRTAGRSGESGPAVRLGSPHRPAKPALNGRSDATSDSIPAAVAAPADRPTVANGNGSGKLPDEVLAELAALERLPQAKVLELADLHHVSVGMKTMSRVAAVRRQLERYQKRNGGS